MINGFARASVSGAHVRADIEPAIRDKPRARPRGRQAELAFENVVFLRRISGRAHRWTFRLPSARATLGIVGPPGSGKSTIAH